MSKRKVGKPFPKGTSGNPGGRKPLAPELKEFKQTSYTDFLEQLQRYGGMNREEIDDELGRYDATMFELMFGNLVIGAAEGDKDARRVLLERLWGKPKADVDVNFNLGEVPTDKLIAMAGELLDDIKSKTIEADFDAAN